MDVVVVGFLLPASLVVNEAHERGVRRGMRM